MDAPEGPEPRSAPDADADADAERVALVRKLRPRVRHLASMSGGYVRQSPLHRCCLEIHELLDRLDPDEPEMPPPTQPTPGLDTAQGVAQLVAQAVGRYASSGLTPASAGVLLYDLGRILAAVDAAAGKTPWAPGLLVEP